MAIKAILTHKSDKDAIPVIKALKNLKIEGIEINIIEPFSVKEWTIQARLQPDEVLAVCSTDRYLAKGKRGGHFTMTMERISPPAWIDDGCWVAAIHNTKIQPLNRDTIIKNMAQQIHGDYIRNFEKRFAQGQAPWGQLRKRPSRDWLASVKATRERINKGQLIDQLLLKMGLVYGPDLITSWMPGLDYFEITKEQFDTISKLVQASFSFKKALCVLYKENEWTREILNIGRPKCVQEWALQNEALEPRKLRLDIALTTSGKPMITEIDGTPGGEGMEIGLPRIYQEVIGPPEKGRLPMNIANGYYALANRIVGEGNPILFLITEDAKEYFAEQQIKAEALARKNIPLIVCRPEDIEIKGTQVFAQGKRVYAWDRFVETYELDTPQVRELAELSESGFLPTFPPFRHFFWEGKEIWALLHHPSLVDFWQREMGREDFTLLKEHSPYTIFPSPEHNLGEGDKNRWYRKRASFGDNLCWGSRGVVSGKREKRGKWRAQYLRDCENFQARKFPYHIYQEAIPHGLHEFYAYERSEERVLKQKFFVRLNPWGYNDGEKLYVCGILATLRYDPRVHGARDALEAPCVII